MPFGSFYRNGVIDIFLSDFSLKRPVLATVLILALVALGLISYLTLGINDWPEIEYSFVTVSIIEPGASPEQLESKIAQPVEDAVGQIAGVKHVYTRVQEGLVTVMAEFTFETEASVAAQEVRDKVGAIRGDLPEDIEEPIISLWDPLTTPIMSLVVTGDTQSIRELTSVVDDLIKKRLQTVDGIGAITVNGTEEREIQLALDKSKLAAYGLTAPELVENLKKHNLEAPIGNLTEGDRSTILRTSGEVRGINGFYDLPVGMRGGVTLRVSDIATVTDGIKDRDSLVRYQGQPAIGLDIVKQSGSNTVKVADQLNQRITELKTELPPGVELTVVRDNSVNTRNSTNDVVKTILEGALLAVLTVFLFLKDWRSTLISAVALPTSIISTFFALRIMGFTLNTMTLMALSLSVGLLIDDAIVVIENIVRHLRMGKTPLDAARDGTKEIGPAVLATTLTLVAVFFPVGMMTGEVGEFFKQFGLSVVFSVLVSLLVSFTLVPLMSARYLEAEEKLPRGPFGSFISWFNRQFEQLAQGYVRLLDLVLAHRWKTVGAAAGLFIFSLALLPMLPSNFLANPDLGELSVVAELDSGLSLPAAQRVTAEMEKIIRSCSEVNTVYSTTTAEQSYIFVKTGSKQSRERTLDQIAADLRTRLSKLPGVRVTVYIKNFAGLEEKIFVYSLLGDDMDTLREYAEKTQRIMEEIPGVVDVTSSYKAGKPEAKVQISGDKAADLGISTGQIAYTLNTLFTGVVVGQYEDGEDRVNVRVRLAEEQRKNMSDLDNIYMQSPLDMASLISLDQVTSTEFITAPSETSRFDRSKEIQLSGNLYGISLGDFNKQFEERFSQEVHLPTGYRLFAGGDAERMTDTFTNIILALITALLLIFFILAAQFESYLDPFCIMLSLPLAGVGAVFGLLLLGSDLSVLSAIGIIMLTGLVTKNAILLVDFIKQARESGVERSEAIKQAGFIRLRPILMTSIAMIFGMVPPALALGVGAELRAPMAHAIIGGLITSTLLTLVVVPAIYSLLDDARAALQHKKQKAAVESV